MTDAGKRPTRRRLLASLGATAAIGATGCLGTRSEHNPTNGECPEYDPVEPATTDWRGVLGPATNTGAVAAEAVPEGDLAIDWTVPVETYVGHHVPVVADDTVYVHDMDDELSAVDAETGERMWTRPLTDPEPAPAVGGGTLVVVTNAATHAFDAATGDRRWKREDIDGGIFGASPIVAGDTVYVQSGVATHAVARSTGETRWRAATGFPSDSTPAVDGDTVYAAGDDTYVRALDTADGTERWRAKTSARIDCNVSVVEGTVLVGTGAGTVLGFDAETGEERWRYRLEPRRAGGERRPRQPETIATDGSRVYVAADDRLVTLALADGTRCWDNRSYAGSYASGIAVGAGKVFVPTHDDRGDAMTVLDATTGNTQQELIGDKRQRSDIGPSVAGGGVYFAGRSAVVRLS
ncbi:outer membrane protein assembly factor BamB family protein [Haloferax volcanii]|uniref:outer membrane protein assembly factor BamB family protein n=1 Tax=Haloferax volcanii TaxID=2246 RepID=UPI0023DA0F17|nr:PQQ-binding-like beta-propeller repeat protein [Haloferax lucentense]WEL27543.1 WD40/PQQ-like beta propeller repeat containing protein [Haloferax lucentense]